MQITTELAQPIADRAVSILQRNVNIMNQEGIIVGSGDPTRLGTFHQAAAEVIRTNRRIEIHPEDEGRWAGARPGVNLPIRLDGRTVGVVGITGPPEQVRPFGELIREMVTLALVQRRAEALHRAQLVARESFLRALLTGEGPMAARMIHDAGLYDLSEGAEYQVLLCRFPPEAGPAGDVWGEAEQSGAMQRLKEAGVRQVIVTGPWDGLGVVIAADPPRDLTEPLLKALPAGSSVAGGLVGSGLSGLRRSYQTAMQSLIAGLRLVGPGALSAYKLRLPRLLASIPAAAAAEFAAAVLGELPPAHTPAGAQLRETLQVFAAVGMTSVQAAERLGIHRHTLAQRLARIATLTGLDPRRWEGLLSLCLAIEVERLHRQDGHEFQE